MQVASSSATLMVYVQRVNSLLNFLAVMIVVNLDWKGGDMLDLVSIEALSRPPARRREIAEMHIDSTVRTMLNFEEVSFDKCSVALRLICFPPSKVLLFFFSATFIGRAVLSQLVEMQFNINS